MRFFILNSIALFTTFSWACPMCAGTGQEKDQYTAPILIGFILLIYIPYIIIFRLIRKYRHLEQPPQ